MIAAVASLAADLASLGMIASSDSGPGWLLLAGPAAGGGAYFGMWSYYRNTGKSHGFERETRIEAREVTPRDTKVDEIKGTKKRSIDGDNRSDHRRRVERF